jgi:hypothetical protein
VSAVNRLLSLVLSIVLIVLGLWAVATSIVVAGGWRWPSELGEPLTALLRRLSADLTGTTLASASTIALCSVLIALGLILLFLEVRPWPPARIALAHDEDEKVAWWVDRASLERLLSRLLTTRTDATQADTHVREQSAVWRITVEATSPEEARGDLEETVRMALTRLERQASMYALRLKIRRPGRVV